jgi:hypothetical protein
MWSAKDHEEAVDEDIEAKGWEGVARVIIVPQADLHRGEEGGVEEEETADHELACDKAANTSNEWGVRFFHQGCNHLS